MNRLLKKTRRARVGECEEYQKIAETQQKADSAEADTVTLVKDILEDVFGYDKYEELTSEHQIWYRTVPFVKSYKLPLRI